MLIQNDHFCLGLHGQLSSVDRSWSANRNCRSLPLFSANSQNICNDQRRPDRNVCFCEGTFDNAACFACFASSLHGCTHHGRIGANISVPPDEPSCLWSRLSRFKLLAAQDLKPSYQNTAFARLQLRAYARLQVIYYDTRL